MVRTAINSLRVLAVEQDAKRGLDALREDIIDDFNRMQKLPLLFLAFREASIAEIGLEEIPDRWLECLDMALGVAIAEAPIDEEAKLCELISGISRQPDRRLWWHLDSLLDSVSEWVLRWVGQSK